MIYTTSKWLTRQIQLSLTQPSLSVCNTIPRGHSNKLNKTLNFLSPYYRLVEKYGRPIGCEVLGWKSVLHLPHSTPSGFKGTRSCHFESGWLCSCLQLNTSDLCLSLKTHYLMSRYSMVNVNYALHLTTTVKT